MYGERPSCTSTIQPNSDSSSTGQVAAAVAAATSALSYIRSWFRTRQRRLEDRHSRHLDARHDIYGLIGRLRQTTAADRVLILTAANGGSVPLPSSTLTITALYEDYGKLPAIKPAWQSRAVSESYCAFLRRLQGEGTIVAEMPLSSETAPERPVISDEVDAMYRADGVTHAISAIVGYSEKAMYFLTLQWAESSYPDPDKLNRRMVRIGNARPTTQANAWRAVGTLATRIGVVGDTH